MHYKSIALCRRNIVLARIECLHRVYGVTCVFKSNHPPEVNVYNGHIDNGSTAMMQAHHRAYSHHCKQQLLSGPCTDLYCVGRQLEGSFLLDGSCQHLRISFRRGLEPPPWVSALPHGMRPQPGGDLRLELGSQAARGTARSCLCVRIRIGFSSET